MDKTKINEVLICNAYKSGKSMSGVEREFGVSRRHIRETLKINKVYIRPIGTYSAKYFPDGYDMNSGEILARKKCSECGVDKDLTEFHKSSGYPLGVKHKCKSCVNSIRKVEWKLLAPKWKEKYTSDKKFRNIVLKRKRTYNATERFREWNNNYAKVKRNTDIEFKVKSNLSRRLRIALKESGLKKDDRSYKYLGCNGKTLISHIESTWSLGMNWSNYGMGNKKWVIDHIIPCRSFNLKETEEQMKCFNYKNLQAMWWIDNAKKGCTLPNGSSARKVYPR